MQRKFFLTFVAGGPILPGMEQKKRRQGRPRNPEPTTARSIHLEDALWFRAQELGRRTRRSGSAVVAIALERHLAELEREAEREICTDL